ncbi:hypothetical protein FDN13_00910 [Caloramator sp. E03]|uniref:hypothetical protein n=1 Tax=Caloramator sp. E03 TaxID=2576307 RepID=UPI00111023C3|nr:hypothetical protein [Caloramator sp. E03]QCX32370.1 hypothetical protein FDN13_00910 [Caloramator sp. E03]
MDLNELLNQYKNKTLEIIKCLENDNYDLKSLIKEREEVINKIKRFKYTQEEFKRISYSLGLYELEQEMISLINTKKNLAKENLDKAVKRDQVNSTYNKIQSEPYILSQRL